MKLENIVNRAMDAHRSGNLQEADRLYTELLKRDRLNVAAMQMLAILKAQQRQHPEAIRLFQRALKIRRTPELLCNLANSFHTIGQHEEAIARYEEALRLKPQYAQASNGLGSALLALGRPDDAIINFDAALALNPRDLAALANRGDAERAAGRFEKALASYDVSLRLAPNDPVLQYSRAFVLQQLDRLEEAAAGYERALSLQPRYPEALYNQGSLFERMGSLDRALASYQRAVIHHPRFYAALNRAGVVLQKLKRFSDALVQFDKAIDVQPASAEALNNRGMTLRRLGRLDEAIDSYNSAIVLRPDFAEAHSNLGNAFRSIYRFDAALKCYAEALRRKSDYAEALNNNGIVLSDMRQFSAALECFDQAIALDPKLADAYYNRGNALRDMKRLDEALPSYETAQLLDPDHPFAFGVAASAALLACDWQRAEQFAQVLPPSILEQGVFVPPFATLGYFDDPVLQRKCAENAVAGSASFASTPAIYGHRKTRVAYLSSDFNNHAVSYVMAAVLEQHDRTQWEFFAVSYGSDDHSELRHRIEKSVDHFLDVQSLSDAEAADVIRKNEIDIAVDLNGHTAGARLGILRRRPCPVQMTFLGYPGTTGASYVDYIIGDAVVTPSDHQPHFSEQILQLPHCYLPTTSRTVAGGTPDRAAHGLPKSGTVFCCFNNCWKITAAVFGSWMRLLARAPGSVLWLTVDNEAAKRNLCSQAGAMGIDPNRLVFAPRMPTSEEHLARYRLADIFLDTFPYNAHVTASDALLMGVPVVTRMGTAFQSRVAASLLQSAELPELITHDSEDYEKLALSMATDPQYLEQIRDKVRTGAARLFAPTNFASGLEGAFRTALEKLGPS